MCCCLKFFKWELEFLRVLDCFATSFSSFHRHSVCVCVLISGFCFISLGFLYSRLDFSPLFIGASDWPWSLLNILWLINCQCDCCEKISLESRDISSLSFNLLIFVFLFSFCHRRNMKNLSSLRELGDKGVFRLKWFLYWVYFVLKCFSDLVVKWHRTFV